MNRPFQQTHYSFFEISFPCGRRSIWGLYANSSGLSTPLTHTHIHIQCHQTIRFLPFWLDCLHSINNFFCGCAFSSVLICVQMSSVSCDAFSAQIMDATIIENTKFRKFTNPFMLKTSINSEQDWWLLFVFDCQMKIIGIFSYKLIGLIQSRIWCWAISCLFVMQMENSKRDETWNISITCDESFGIFGVCVVTFDTVTIQLTASHFKFQCSSDSSLIIVAFKLKLSEWREGLPIANKHSLMHSYQSAFVFCLLRTTD